MKGFWLSTARIVVFTCTLVLGSVSAAPAPPRINNPLGQMAVLTCPTLVDLHWDWERMEYWDGQGSKCSPYSWSVWRDITPDFTSMELVHIGSYDGRDDFCRDENVTPWHSYYYAVRVVYQCPSGETPPPVMWTEAGATYVTDRCTGDVLHDLLLSNLDLVEPAMQVWENVTLLLSHVVSNGGIIRSAGHGDSPEPPGGVIQVGSSTINNTTILFAAAGDNYLTGSVVVGDPEYTDVLVGFQAEILIAGNTLDKGWIRISGSPQVDLSGSLFRHGAVSIATESGLPADRISIRSNTFRDAAQGTALRIAGSNVTILGNTFCGTEEERTRGAILLESSSSEDPGVAAIEGNSISGYDEAITMLDDTNVTLKHNVIWDNNTGMYVRHRVQATFEGNTIADNGTGVSVMDEPTLTLRDNCIAGNFYGIQVSPAGPGLTADAKQNWWGHVSGPQHPENAAGLGDTASPQVLIADWLEYDTCSLETAADIVGQAGGTVGTSSGSTAITLPAGAVVSDTVVLLQVKAPSAAPQSPPFPGTRRPLRIVDLAALPRYGGEPLQVLLELSSLQMQLTEQESSGVDKSTLGVYHLSDGSNRASRATPAWGSLEYGAWISVPTEVDPGRNVLTATVESTGLFAAVGEPTGGWIYLPLVTRLP